MAVIAAGAAVTLLLGLLPGPAALLVFASMLARVVRGVFALTEAALAPGIGAGSRPRSAAIPALFGVLAACATAGAGLAAAPGPGRRPPSPPDARAEERAEVTSRAEDQ